MAKITVVPRSPVTLTKVASHEPIAELNMAIAPRGPRGFAGKDVNAIYTIANNIDDLTNALNINSAQREGK